MKSVFFPASTSPPPAVLPVRLTDLIRNAGAAACFHPVLEGSAIASICPFLGSMGWLAEGETGLAGLMAGAYADMATRASFIATRSAVPFCLSANPEGGHYFLHVPRGADSCTPVLLLFHGYGGNMLYFPWAIWKELGDCILIGPSWQVNWSEGGFQRRCRYVADVLKHAEEKSGIHLGKPWLVALSQGGDMAFSLAAAKPKNFSGLIGISTFCGDPRNLEKLPQNFPVRMIHGGRDARLLLEDASKTVRWLAALGGDAKLANIKGASHFLMLSHRETVGKHLCGWIEASS